MKRSHSTILACALFCSMGCNSVEMLPPRSSMVRGTTERQKTFHILALPAACGTLSSYATTEASVGLEGVCSEKFLSSANQLVRGELELHGHSVVDSELVNAQIRSRAEVEVGSETTSDGRLKNKSQTKTTNLEGARFEDVTPAEQAKLTEDLAIDAVLGVRVWVGAMRGFGGRRQVRVQIRLRKLPSDELVWATRCDAEVGLARSDQDAIEEASRCAIRGAL